MITYSSIVHTMKEKLQNLPTSDYETPRRGHRVARVIASGISGVGVGLSVVETFGPEHSIPLFIAGLVVAAVGMIAASKTF